MATILPGVCNDCGGQRFIRTSRGLKRCACYWLVHNECVPAILKHGEPPILDETRLLAPWPLTSRTDVGGDYTAFRHKVWESFLYYLHSDRKFRTEFTYVVMEAGRLSEIHFQRDPEYKSYRQLIEPSLLVLICGRADVRNNFTPHLTQVVLTLREMHGKVSWVYAARRDDMQGAPATAVPEVVVGGSSQQRRINEVLYGPKQKRLKSSDN